MLSYCLKVSSLYSPENVLIPTKSEILKEPHPFSYLSLQWWGQQQSLQYYLRELQSRPYVYGTDCLFATR
jgi:hypothetical protein